MTHHDTAAIRSLARRLESTASTLYSTSRSSARQIDGINDELRGDTAKAIDQTVEKLDEELQSIRTAITKCANALYQYAHELDVADAKASSLIGSK